MPRSTSSGHMTLIQSRLNIDATSWRCIDNEAKLYKRHLLPAGPDLIIGYMYVVL